MRVLRASEGVNRNKKGDNDNKDMWRKWNR